jgi:hypothetical protein
MAFRRIASITYTIRTFPLSHLKKITVHRDQPSAGSEMKPLTEDRGCDNVLLGQGYRTPRGAVIDEYGAVVEW